MVWEFLCTDVEGIESVGAVGAVFEQVFLGLCQFLAGLVFAEAVAPATDPCRLYGENQVLVVLAVEEWHQALLAGKALVDEQIFFVVAHRVADIHRPHSPAVTFELVDHDPTEILFVDGIV